MNVQTYSPILPSTGRPSLSERQRALAQSLAQENTTRAAPAMPAGNAGLALALGNAGLSAIEGLQYKAQSEREAAATAAARDRFSHMVGSYAPGVPGAGGGPGRAPSSMAGAPQPGDTGAGYGSISPKEVAAYIRERAPLHGVDPEVAVKVSGSEGLNTYVGDHGSSFGPFQLHYGNVSGAGSGNQVSGLGDAFTKATGLDARDPSTWKQQVDFALQQAAQGGWTPWHGAQNVNVARWDGIGPNYKGPVSPSTATASADMPAPNAQPVAGQGMPGDMQQPDSSAAGLAMALAAPQTNTRPAQAGLDAGLGVAEAQKQGNPSMMGAPPPDMAPDGYGTNVAVMAAGAQPQAGSSSPYGIIPPDTGDPAAQSLAVALGPFGSVPTSAGTDTPKGFAPLPGSSQPTLQQGAGITDTPAAVSAASNGVADAQAQGMPSFTGLPETNGKKVVLSNSPDMGAPSAPQMAGADVPLPPVRPDQALLDALGQSAPGPTAGSAPASGADPTSTGSIDMGSPASMPAPNATPAMAPGLPADMTGGPGGGFAPIGKNAGFETPQAFNLAQSGGSPAAGNAMADALGAFSSGAAPTSPAPASAAPQALAGALGPGSAFRTVMDGGDIGAVAQQQDARLNGGQPGPAALGNALGGGPAVIPAPAGAPAASPGWRDDAASILSDPYATPAMQSYAAKLLEQQAPAPVAWQHIERPDGSVVAFNPQTQELRQLAGPNAKASSPDAPKWQVIGEDAYGNKQYGYPPAPESSPQAAPDGQATASGQPAAASGLAAGDAALAGLSGQDMLGKLAESQPALAGQVKAVVEGRAPYPSGLLLKTPYGQRLAALVTQADPTFETGNSGARTKVRADFTSGGANSSASQIAAGNTALQHLAEVSDAANALGNHDTGLPGNDLYNAAGNALNSFRGRGANQVAFDNVVGKYVEEVTKFYRGTGGTESDIKRDLGNLSSSMSPSELRAAIGAQQALIQGKVTALQDKWHNGMGPLGGDFPIITKNTQAALDRIGGFVNGAPTAPAAPAAAPAGPAPVANLGVGQSTTINGYGVRRVK